MKKEQLASPHSLEKKWFVVRIYYFCQFFLFLMYYDAGVLPDGTYGKNTKVEYCCRKDGASERPIRLPSSAPFYLYKLGDVCQEVYLPILC